MESNQTQELAVEPQELQEVQEVQNDEPKKVKKSKGDAEKKSKVDPDKKAIYKAMKAELADLKVKYKRLFYISIALAVQTVALYIAVIVLSVSGGAEPETSPELIVPVQQSNAELCVELGVEMPEGKYPFTSLRKVTYSDIADLTPSERRVMRNEIFARHGYIFQSADLRNYFKQQEWYRARSRSVQLSSIEKYNVAFIKQYE